MSLFATINEIKGFDSIILLMTSVLDISERIFHLFFYKTITSRYMCNFV